MFQPLHRQLVGTLEIIKNAAVREIVEYIQYTVYNFGEERKYRLVLEYSNKLH